MLAVDSGGSGLRCALAPGSGGPPVAERRTDTPVRTGPGGIDASHLLAQLLPAVRESLERAGAGEITAVCVGAAGMATLGGELRDRLPGALREAFGVRRLALAADAVTAYAGALGVRPGVVVAAGTGLIGLGTDLTGWRRVDGWGHLLGDLGSGAWIGRAGMEAALCAFDGRPGGSPALLERLEAVLGPVAALPGRLYPRTDRAAVLASFAPQVAGCAADADPVAERVMREAAGHLLATAAAARTAAGGDLVAFTGGLLNLGPPLLDPLHAGAPAVLPGARLVAPAGDPLAGALGIARSLTAPGPSLPRDDALLTVHEG